MVVVAAAAVVDAAEPFEVAVVVAVDERAFRFESEWNPCDSFVVAYWAFPAHRSCRAVALHGVDQWTLVVSFDHDAVAYQDAFDRAVPDGENEEVDVLNNRLEEGVADWVAFQIDPVEPEIVACEKEVVPAFLFRTLDSLDADEAFLVVRSLRVDLALEVSFAAFVGRSEAVPSHRREPSWLLGSLFFQVCALIFTAQLLLKEQLGRVPVGVNY